MRVPQPEGNWGYSRYLRATTVGDLVFPGVKGLVVAEADETRAPFRMDPGSSKLTGFGASYPGI